MKEKLETIQIQETILELLPQWNDNIVKPFKKLLDEGVSLEMYYCIQRLKWLGGAATMTQLSKSSRMPKHQMTKLVNNLVEYRFVERISDPSDRRIVKIELTEDGRCFVDHFLNENAKYFQDLIEQIDKKDREVFQESLTNILSILCKLNSDSSPLDKETIIKY
ncbi:MAG: HTH marR-type domain-containing protein [Shouchella clausii]|jgi:DNA-binding MarR family transcriptional regulator